MALSSVSQPASCQPESSLKDCIHKWLDETIRAVRLVASHPLGDKRAEGPSSGQMPMRKWLLAGEVLSRKGLPRTR